MKIHILTETHMVDEPDTGVSVFKTMKEANKEALNTVKEYEKEGYDVSLVDTTKWVLDDNCGDIRVVQITEKEV